MLSVFRRCRRLDADVTCRGFVRVSSSLLKYSPYKQAKSGPLVAVHSNARRLFENISTKRPPVAFVHLDAQMSSQEDIAVTNFRKYLRINSEQPNPDYGACKEFFFTLGEELGWERSSFECVPGKPFVILTLRGTNDTLPSLILYSHTDVVPTEKAMWKHDPYGGVKEDGKIYGRGTQDMKSVSIQYIEALRRLHSKGQKNFLRTVHLVFGPDEEVGGEDGMKKFVETEEFRKLNLGFVLDEGLATEESAFKVYYGERNPWWLIVSCKGQPGHGSRFIENTASEKLSRVINNFMSFRAEQKKLLESSPHLKLGNVVSVNLTKVEGGAQVNVLPAEMKAWFDIRVPPTVDFEELEEKIRLWCTDAGTDVTYSFVMNARVRQTTPTSDEDPFWRAFAAVFKELNYEIEKEIFIGSTDSRYLREKGIRSIGFSPMNQTPTLLHDHNEYLEESVFLRGVHIYEALIPRLANVEAS